MKTTTMTATRIPNLMAVVLSLACCAFCPGTPRSPRASSTKGGWRDSHHRSRGDAEAVDR